MDLTTILSGVLTSNNMEDVVQKMGIENKQAQVLIKVGLPVLLEGLKNNTQTSEGAQSLSDALNDHTSVSSLLTDLLSDTSKVDAQKILGHILGQKQEQVQTQVAKQAGVNPDQSSQMLGVLAQTILGSLGQSKKQEGLSTDAIAQTVGTIATQVKDNGMMDQILLSILDKNKDGSYQDDLIAMAINWIKTQFSTKK